MSSAIAGSLFQSGVFRIEHHLKLTSATINPYINVLSVRRKSFRFLSFSIGIYVNDYESIFASPAVDNFLD